MKPVGKPDAGNSQVRFDERGAETGDCQSASHRAVPRLYPAFGVVLVQQLEFLVRFLDMQTRLD